MRFCYLSCLWLSIGVAIRIRDHQTPLASTSVRPISAQNWTQSLINLHKDLVNINSITGYEQNIGSFLTEYLISHNFTVETQVVAPLVSDPAAKTRQNVFAYKSPSRSTRILLTSHMDTVAPYFPYELRNGTEIWGRGAADDKGSLASQIIALEELLAASQISESDVSLLFVVGEERDGAGMKKANELGLAWETVIFGEPSEHKLVAGHKGALVFEIIAHGKAAHSSYPELGVNANSMLIPALAAIDKMKLPSSKKFGTTDTNIGRMEGGVAMNVIPEKATATVLSRLAAGTPEDAMEVIERVVKEIDSRLQLDFGHRFGPVDCDTDVAGEICPTFEDLRSLNLMKGGRLRDRDQKRRHRRSELERQS